MNAFEINTIGKSLIKDKIKDFYQMLISGVFAYFLLLSAFRYTVDSPGYLTFLTIFLTTLYLFVFVIIPITLKIRINKIIRGIQIINNQVSLITNREYLFNIKELKIEDVKNRFTGFSSKNKSGILIKTKTGKEFWIVEDFYIDYEILKTQLIKIAKESPC